MRRYLEISISANERQRELLIPTMVELGCSGFMETDIDLLCYFETTSWDSARLARLEPEIRNLLGTISCNAAIRIREVPHENWNANWEESIRPIEVGQRFVIRPSWAEYENRDNRKVILIDPKMSFGTGYHETTRLMMLLLEEYLQNGDSLLDVGTGTGILAIAGALLGASRVEGIDIDEWSLENAPENVAINDVADVVTISDTALASVPDSAFTTIASNITLNTNIESLTEFLRILKPQGLLLLSGFLRTDEVHMEDAVKRSGFVIVKREHENEWGAIAARKE